MFVSLKRKIRNLKFNLKMWWQRKRYGFCNLDLWNIGYSTIDHVYPILKRYMELKHHSHPMDMTEEEWNVILNKMLFSFEQIYLEEHNGHRIKSEDRDKIEEGFQLFGRYLLTLWD